MVDREFVAVEQARVRWDDVAEAQPDDVARHEFLRRWRDPLPVALHSRLDCEPRLQGVNRIAGLALFPEPDDRIGKQQNKNDEEIGPMADDCRENDRDFDHPWDRTPEVAQKLEQPVGFLLRDLVRAILRQPLLRLRIGEPLRRRPQLFLHLRQRQLLQVVFGDRL